MVDDLPNALELRELKYGPKSTDAQRNRIADLMLERGHLAEALDLFMLSGNREGTRVIRERALAEGRPALLLMLERTGEPLEPGEWRRAGKAAREAGRLREAFRCFTLGEDEESLAALKELLPGYEIYIPQGK